MASRAFNLAIAMGQQNLAQPLRSNLNLARYFVNYCPIYSATTNNLFGSATKKNHSVVPQLANRHLTIASSGYFAPSTVTTHQRAACSPQGNLNVFEDSAHLPSLPVPPLNETLERLKETIWPIAMNSAEFAKALELIDAFSGSAGQKLNLLLKVKASQTKNWMTHDWWTQEVYLKSRAPLVINSNPSMIYPTLPFEVTNQRALINTVAQLISGVIDFKLSLIHGYNPEAVSADNELRLDPNLCYNQYRHIFGSTRIPSEQIDHIRVKSLSITHTNLDAQEPFNIIVSCRGKFFEIQLKDIENEQGRIVALQSILDKILDSVQNVPSSDGTCAGEGAGVLTASDRDEWSQAFRLMDSDSMESIQEAQFVVCIDTISSDTDATTTSSPTSVSVTDEFSNPLLSAPLGSEQHMAALARQVLHGDRQNIGNRWFDKALQLIVVADNNAERLLGAGINFEHSLADGVVVTKLIEYSHDKTVQKSQDHAKDNFFAKQQIQTQEPAVFRQLKMFEESNLDSVGEHVKKAKQDYVSHVSQFDLSYLSYRNYGSNAIKSWRFSPDSWYQVAMQLAYYNLHQRLGPCYESASTRRFAYGRTETIRSLTKDVAQFCFEPKLDTLKLAIQSHKTYAVAASNAAAIDRVLLGHRLIFNELKSNVWSWGVPADVEAVVDNMTRRDITSQTEAFERNTCSKLEQSCETSRLFTERELATIGAFFNNELIERSKRFALSTSQVSSMHPNITMSYGPLLADGYGCCYNISGQQIVASITANSSNQSFSCEVHKFNDSLRSSLDRMRAIVEEQHPQRN